jgi:hypothetical protein
MKLTNLIIASGILFSSISHAGVCMVEDHAHGRINFVTRQPLYAHSWYGGVLKTLEQCWKEALAVHVAMGSESNYKGTSMKWWEQNFGVKRVFVPKADIKIFINSDDTFTVSEKGQEVQKDKLVRE